MRELRMGAPLINELNDIPFFPAQSASESARHKRRVERIVHACGQLVTEKPFVIETIAPDHEFPLSALAQRIKVSLSQSRRSSEELGYLASD